MAELHKRGASMAESRVFFFTGGDLNVELKLERGSGEWFQGIDILDWYGLNGSEFQGWGEDLVMCEKNFDGCSY